VCHVRCSNAHREQLGILSSSTLVVQLRKLFGLTLAAIIARLEVTAGQRALLLDTYRGTGSG
jgi:hypothetical protein